jgi:DNA repair protein RadC
LKQALGLIEVEVLDHIIIGEGEPLSMVEYGWL